MATEPRINPIRPTDDEARRLARGLIDAARFGALATLDPGTGFPVATRVALATDEDGMPVTLVSRLSNHTANLFADTRVSLLVGEPGKGDPLTHPRITLFAQAREVVRGSEAHARIRGRFLAKNPKARLYVDFGDFLFVAFAVQRASLNGGFGKAYELTREDVLGL